MSEKLLLIGTCRIKNAVSKLPENLRLLCLDPKGYTHYPQETVQFLELAKEERQFSHEYLPLILDDINSGQIETEVEYQQWQAQLKSSIEQSSTVLIELSSLKKLRFEFFDQHGFVNITSRESLLAGKNNKVFDSQLVANSVASKIQVQMTERDEYLNYLDQLLEILKGKRVILCPHFMYKHPSGTGYLDNRNIIRQWLSEFAISRNIEFFDQNIILEHLGAENVLLDSGHYNELGEQAMSLCLQHILTNKQISIPIMNEEIKKLSVVPVEVEKTPTVSEPPASVKDKQRKVFIGFNVDMDSAWGETDREGEYVPEHLRSETRNKEEKSFKEGMNYLLYFFNTISVSEGVTWFVNEPSYRTAENYPYILQQCLASGGEIGLHTHLNGEHFSKSPYSISKDRSVWEKDGIREPKLRLDRFIEENSRYTEHARVRCFKAGNHMRNAALMECLIDSGFDMDVSMVYNTKSVRNVPDLGEVTLYDDSGLNPSRILSIKSESGSIMEFPETGVSVARVKKTIEAFFKRDMDAYIQLQIHPWQAFEGVEILQKFRNIVEFCRENYEAVEAATVSNMYDHFMQDVGAGKQVKSISASILDRAIGETDFVQAPKVIELEKAKSDVISDVSNRIIEMSKKRLDALGDVESGLSNYYIARVKNGNVFSADDLSMIAYVLENFKPGDAISEVAAGAGQVSHALSVLGYKDINLFEYDRNRSQYAQAIKHELNTTCRVLTGDFRLHDVNPCALIFSVNAVASSLGEQDLDFYVNAMKMGSKIVFKEDYYGKDNQLFHKLNEVSGINKRDLWVSNSVVLEYSLVSEAFSRAA